MKFYSTNGKSPIVGLEEAVMNGLAPDGGLYMPSSIPHFSNDFFARTDSLSFQDIAFEVGKPFFMSVVPENTLKAIMQESFNFEVPVNLPQQSWGLLYPSFRN